MAIATQTTSVPAGWLRTSGSQTLNFHHDIVDSVIWKVRRKPLQKTLELGQ